MRLNGNKACPHCGARQTIFTPLIKPFSTWDCPACGGRLYSPMSRNFVMVLACSLIQFPMMLVSDTLAWRLSAILIVWVGFGMLFAHLALDVQVTESSTRES